MSIPLPNVPVPDELAQIVAEFPLWYRRFTEASDAGGALEDAVGFDQRATASIHAMVDDAARALTVAANRVTEFKSAIDRAIANAISNGWMTEEDKDTYWDSGNTGMGALPLLAIVFVICVIIIGAYGLSYLSRASNNAMTTAITISQQQIDRAATSYTELVRGGYINPNQVPIPGSQPGGHTSPLDNLVSGGLGIALVGMLGLLAFAFTKRSRG